MQKIYADVMQKLQTVTRKFMQKLLFMQKIYAEITNSNYAEIRLGRKQQLCRNLVPEY